MYGIFGVFNECVVCGAVGAVYCISPSSSVFVQTFRLKLKPTSQIKVKSCKLYIDGRISKDLLLDDTVTPAYWIVADAKVEAMNKAVSNAADELSKAAMETAVVTPVVTPTEVAKGDGVVGTNSTKHADEVVAAEDEVATVKRADEPKKPNKAAVKIKNYINIIYIMTVDGKMTKDNKNVVVATAQGGDREMSIRDQK
eukprot:GHVS01049974.1.p1 GENE.GHVS01049974.1~~GHVS01049974.1.p1  ORF type:complete len:198 (+),score=41.53 GHVS01049974.1:22-615(+)